MKSSTAGPTRGDRIVGPAGGCDLNGIPTRWRDLPYLQLSRSVRGEVDPLAVARKAGPRIHSWMRSDISRFPARSGDHVFLPLPFHIGEVHDPFAVGRP